nr:PREDICTED: endogenous retrovirus group K member 6 Gag polyprotein-like [Rhinolophus sinicus]
MGHASSKDLYVRGLKKLLAARGSRVSREQLDKFYKNCKRKVEKQLQDYYAAHGLKRKGCKLEKVKQAGNEEILPSAASPAERVGGARHTEGFFKVNKEPVCQESPVESWEDLDPQDQEKLEDEVAKYDRDKNPPLVAMAQGDEQPAGTALSFADQLKKIQGQLIELKVAVDGGNCPQGPQIPFRDQWNPRGKDPPTVNPSAPPPEEPCRWGPPLQSSVWEMPAEPSPSYVKPGSDSVVRSPLQMACEEAHKQGESTEQFEIYPIFERPDQAGRRFREWRPFQWKQLKELKEACVQYGPIAPFTMAILDALSSEVTPAEDWKHIAHACLSGGDYLLWKSEFYENCKKKANQNALRQIPITFDMLAGKGIYAKLRNQMGFAVGAYAQTTAAAKDAWRMLPDSSRKEKHVSQIRQGPDEPFQDFVARLNTAAGRIFGPSADTQSFIMQLAYENANSTCQAVIRPF